MNGSQCTLYIWNYCRKFGILWGIGPGLCHSMTKVSFSPERDNREVQRKHPLIVIKKCIKVGAQIIGANRRA